MLSFSYFLPFLSSFRSAICHAYDEVLKHQQPHFSLHVESRSTKTTGHLRREEGGDHGTFFKFVTSQRPDIRAPRWDIKVYNDSALAPGYWFVAPYAQLDQRTAGAKWNGPHIYSPNGDLVWSGASLFKHFNTFDFRTVDVGGEEMLSLIFPHQQHGEGIVVGSDYEIYKKVVLSGELKGTNMHDFNVIDSGETVLTLTRVPGNSTLEQSAAVGFDGNCSAGWEGFKELSVRDSEVLFSWSARDWLGLDESTLNLDDPVEARCGRGWDILHLNSIDKAPDGDYILSSRHTDAVYKISHLDGHVVWRLGGTKSDFHFTNPAAVFSRQHHVRVQAQNETHMVLTLFDNAVGDHHEEPTNPVSRGLLLALHTTTRTVQLLAHYDHPRGRHTNTRGSVQVLPNGNVFMGWTWSSLQSEHSPDGILLMEASLREGTAHSYRNYKYPWVGRPTVFPDVVSTALYADDGSVETVAYVSWNGATEVVAWNVYEVGPSDEVARLVATTMKYGFESSVKIEGLVTHVQVEALGEDGKALEHGMSRVVKTIDSKNLQSEEEVATMEWLEEATASHLEPAADPVSNRISLFAFGFGCCAALMGVVRYMMRRSGGGAMAWWQRVPGSGSDSEDDDALSDEDLLPEDFEMRSLLAERAYDQLELDYDEEHNDGRFDTR